MVGRALADGCGDLVVYRRKFFQRLDGPRLGCETPARAGITEGLVPCPAVFDERSNSLIVRRRVGRLRAQSVGNRGRADRFLHRDLHAISQANRVGGDSDGSLSGFAAGDGSHVIYSIHRHDLGGCGWAIFLHHGAFPQRSL